MRSTILLLLFLFFVRVLDAYGQELNFNPNEKLSISLDSLDLKALEYAFCTKIQTVYPVVRFFSRRTVKIQECFIEPERNAKFVIVTYYDSSRKIKAPIAFVFVARRENGWKGGEIWAKADQGFIETGCVNRIWQTFVPTDLSIEEQLKIILLKGFKKNCKPEENHSPGFDFVHLHYNRGC